MANWFVIAQRYTDGATILLVGPFDTIRAANRMVVPVRNAVQSDAEYTTSNIRAERITGKRAKRQAVLDLSRLDIKDVINASRILR